MLAARLTLISKWHGELTRVDPHNRCDVLVVGEQRGGSQEVDHAETVA